MSAHTMQCPMCQRGEPCEVAAVDATLDVAAELARVTAERDELAAQFAVHNALNQERDRSADALLARAERNEAEIERLKAIIADQARDEIGRVSMPLAAHNKVDAARRERDEAEARAEKAEKANATLRGLAERARECLASTSHHEECGRSDECDDADPGECGNHDPGYCPACDCGVSEWHETAAELYAALKETT